MKLYNDIAGSDTYSNLRGQEREIILLGLKSTACMFRAPNINEPSLVTDECRESMYLNRTRYKNYTKRIPCIGNWPAFQMTNMPYKERES